MRPLGTVFDGSISLFESQRFLCNFIRHDIWLGQFTRVRHDHLHFVLAVLTAFRSLGICCAFTGLYPVYISGILDKYCLEDDFCICHLHIAKSSPRACLNVVQLIWNNIKIIALIKYAVVCVPLETPNILFLLHYRACSDGWGTYSLCAACSRDCTLSIQQFVYNCTFPHS